MEYALAVQNSSRQGARLVAVQVMCSVFKERWHAPSGNRPEARTVISVQHTKRTLAQPHRLIQHRIEHRCEVAGRRIDDAEDFGGGSLLGKRLITFSFEFVA